MPEATIHQQATEASPSGTGHEQETPPANPSETNTTTAPTDDVDPWSPEGRAVVQRMTMALMGQLDAATGESGNRERKPSKRKRAVVTEPEEIGDEPTRENAGTGELIVVETVARGFDYETLEPAIATCVKHCAGVIREKVRQSLENIIAIGQELIKVKVLLIHGEFLPWLAAEFGCFGPRTVRRFMSVAVKFGGKSDNLSDLKIAPSAAYLLAAPSTPENAREKAIEKAKAGEVITIEVAKSIITGSKPKPKKKKPSIENGWVDKESGISLSATFKKAKGNKSLVLVVGEWFEALKHDAENEARSNS
jgi:hypothetical protein